MVKGRGAVTHLRCSLFLRTRYTAHSFSGPLASIWRHSIIKRRSSVGRAGGRFASCVVAGSMICVRYDRCETEE